MVEYNLNAIRATAGEEICICAKISDAYGDAIAVCSFHLYNDKEQIYVVKGIEAADKIWEFHIPAEITAGLQGRYWYSVCDENHQSLGFKEPIYLV